MDIKVNFKGGGSLVNLEPVFSHDKQQIFVCWRNSILSYSTNTGKLLHEYKGHKENIVGFCFHKYNSYDCITACSITGEVIVWKVVNNFKVLQKNLSNNRMKLIKSFHILPNEDDLQLEVLLSYETEDTVALCLYNFKKKSYKYFSLTLTKQSFQIQIGGSPIYAAIVQENYLYLIKMNKVDRFWKQKIHGSRRFTCVACHPTEEIVLTGDNTGRVLVWQSIFSDKRSQAVFHWHTLPVNCLTFSKSGSFFYSGADECVLVKWQLDNPMQRNFLPRLTATIKQISVSEENKFIAIATSDNAIHIINSQFNEVALIQHLVLGDQFETGIVYDSHTKALVMNGHLGHIQFYLPQDMTLLYNLDIVARNRITNERETVMLNTDVTKLAISKMGGWLATVEERKDFQYQYEIRLKFWRFDDTRQTFELNTSVEYPHEKSISHIRFQPIRQDTDLKCVTVGLDKQYKIWQMIETETVYKKGRAWKCLSSVAYRDLDCSGLAFSMDGSLVAVGFDKMVTAWTPDTCELKCSLKHATNKSKIKHIEFGNENQCHLLVAASSEQIAIWNLLTLSMVWMVSVDVSLLVSDPLSTNMAVITKNKKVYVFSPESKDTIFKSENLLESQGDIIAATFIPTRNCNDISLNWYERSQLYFIDSRKELYCICGEQDEEALGGNVYYNNEEKMLTPFSQTLPISKKSNVKSFVPSTHLYDKDSTDRTLKTYLDAPLQTMIPIRFTCGSLISSMVFQKEKQTAN